MESFVYPQAIFMEQNSAYKTRQRHPGKIGVVCDVTVKTGLCLPTRSELHNTKG